ncbi:MAG TPA: MFS transporter [Thermoleophilia bacterium]|nr:MFS transporter [Thermoleophilia bacterium]
MQYPASQSRTQSLLRRLRVFPRRFWLLVGGTLLYLIAISFAFPYTPLLLQRRLGVTTAVIGLIMGGSALIGLPLQPFAGALSDRYGRRAVMMGCALCEAVAYGGLALVHGFWPICLLMVVDRGIGWPLYLTASNAMTADLLRPHLRAEGYGLVRLMIGAGYVIGPTLAAVVLALGAPIAALFLVAGGGCLLYFAFVVLVLKETHPHRTRPRPETEISEGPMPFGVLSLFTRPGRLRARERRRARAGHGWGRVLRDRRFVLFCLVSLLPLFIFGQTYTTYPVLLTDYLHLPEATWGLLVSVIGLVMVVAQVPAVRAVRRLDPLHAVAVASLLYALGMGLAAFVPLGWPLVMTVGVLSVAMALFSPLATTAVSHLAAPEMRGRYMGTWTLVWTGGGSALAPLLGGLLLGTLGPQAMCAALLTIGGGGAVLYLVLRAKGPAPMACSDTALEQHPEECAERARAHREAAPAN